MVSIEDLAALPAPDLFRLDGRVAVITGGAGMLGRQHAAAISEMGGVSVLIDVNLEAAETAARELRASTGATLHAFAADITNEQQVQQVVEEVRAHCGRIDILINNAALTVKGGGSSFGEYFAPFPEYPVELFDLALEVNLRGAFLVTREVGRVMEGQGSGVVVNISSDVALISPDHRIYEGMTYGDKPFNTPIAYSMSKAALLAFTRYLATYWAKKGIRVNALSPAGVYDDHEPGFVARLSNLIPLGRMAHRSEYRGALLFLCSDASSFMTGGNLVVDGGRTCW